jgi:hypothetical protein
MSCKAVTIPKVTDYGMIKCDVHPVRGIPISESWSSGMRRCMVLYINTNISEETIYPNFWYPSIRVSIGTSNAAHFTAYNGSSIFTILVLQVN